MKTHSFVRKCTCFTTSSTDRSIPQNIAVYLKSLLLSRLGSTTSLIHDVAARAADSARGRRERSRRTLCVGSVVFQEGRNVRAARHSQVVTRRRHSRHGLRFASLGAVVGGDVAAVVVLVPGTGGGVTVGYASHSCRGRRTETNRLCMPAAALLASWPLSGLPCPFLFLPASLFLSLSFLSFRSFVSYPPTTTATAMASFAYPRQRNTSSCRSSHTFQGVPHVRRRDTSVCFCPATRNQGSRALRLIIRRQSAFRITGKSLIKKYVA